MKRTNCAASLLRSHEGLTVSGGSDWASYSSEILLPLLRRLVLDISEKSCHDDENGAWWAQRVLGRQWRQHFGIDSLLLVPHGWQQIPTHLLVEQSSYHHLLGREMGSELVGREMGSELVGREMGSELVGREMGREIVGREMGSDMVGCERAVPSK